MSTERGPQCLHPPTCHGQDIALPPQHSWTLILWLWGGLGWVGHEAVGWGGVGWGGWVMKGGGWGWDRVGHEGVGVG